MVPITRKGIRMSKETVKYTEVTFPFPIEIYSEDKETGAVQWRAMTHKPYDAIRIIQAQKFYFQEEWYCDLGIFEEKERTTFRAKEMSKLPRKPDPNNRSLLVLDYEAAAKELTDLVSKFFKGDATQWAR